MCMGKLKTSSLLVALLLVGLSAPTYAARESSRENVLSLEALGRAGWYSLNFDRLVTDYLAIGGGLAWYPSTWTIRSRAVAVLPLYVNYYFGSNTGRFFTTAGVFIAFDNDNSGNSNSGVGRANYKLHNDEGFLGTAVSVAIGGGYEYRGSDFGLLFRITPYILLERSIAPWIGLSVGYAF